MTAIAALAGAEIAPFAAWTGSAAAQPDRTIDIRCFSRPGGQASCRLPSGTTSVTYKGPDASLRCREGETWRQTGDRLVVRDGCGGIFEARIHSGGGWGGSGGSGGSWGGSGGSWGGSGGSGGSWGGSGGEITCRSIDNRQQTCRVATGNRVTLVRQLSVSPCIEGETWRYDSRSITVRNGCQAVFAYGAGAGGSGGGWGDWGGWGGNRQDFAGEIRCRSDENRYNRCRVNTGGRVELVERLSRANCVRGSTWGFDSSGIWVNHGCEARFAYGYGSYRPSPSGGHAGDDGGGNTAAGVLLGAGLAAGLIAILNARGHKADDSRQSAALSADYGLFPSAARRDAQACLSEAARQLGVSGATRVQLRQVVATEQRTNGWRLVSSLTGTWPREQNRLEVDCTTANGRVAAFDVRMG
ncbi:DUF3011 domain-containing protein [Thermaurantiacus sp.]